MITEKTIRKQLTLLYKAEALSEKDEDSKDIPYSDHNMIVGSINALNWVLGRLKMIPVKASLEHSSKNIMGHLGLLERRR